ncbi:hypothetical protein [Mammaliicoccus sciuri]|uniref:hypothetical protein n=1 Tax=Mammaliicoccus sciuri TaxID=1296 RepID=UPI002DBBFD53|nr:hypothetical protein [Mammaliicoccus sciuri]MEB7049785.1 hypothetical protein [Mammaliicoccus sciuri]
MVKAYPRIPKNALYSGEPDALKTFEELDSPIGDIYLTMDELEKVMNWVKQLEPSKTMNRKYTSYTLKGIFERSPEGFYITNGQMKGVMYLMGFKSDNQHELNWNFNVTERSVKSLINRK